ncbi:hypothetical protein [Dactylosporangium sp. NPDC005555]|uniref:hypothetical protein n=1 Tax=Dactylosporangium sp. NPDC005555 TaxID=3154889 RepID=UPI0033B960FC
MPCSFLAPLVTWCERNAPEQYRTANNKGEAVAIAAGAYLTGRRPVVMMRNSGLGNAVDPLTSLCYPMRIPLLLLVTWRGEPGRPDESLAPADGRDHPAVARPHGRGARDAADRTGGVPLIAARDWLHVIGLPAYAPGLNLTEGSVAPETRHRQPRRPARSGPPWPLARSTTESAERSSHASMSDSMMLITSL